MSGALLITAIGALCFLGVGGSGSVGFVVLGLAALGLGMGAATTPATALLVSSIPPEQAGVGSAMNDVTREFGTAFGVAVLGSVLALRYSALIATPSLASASASTARGGIGGALQVARGRPAASAAQLRDSAHTAFTSGFHAARSSARWSSPRSRWRPGSSSPATRAPPLPCPTRPSRRHSSRAPTGRPDDRARPEPGAARTPRDRASNAGTTPPTGRSRPR
jgi:hypothetical protein